MKKQQIIKVVLLSFIILCITSCETEKEKLKREAREEQQKIELLEKQQEEKEKKEIYNTYINNSLKSGSTPYAYCYGNNKNCSDYGCSQIKVKTPNNSDVIVTIKKNDRVYRHAYIKAGSEYTFEFPNGLYQAFFYYGKGWNPDKFMKEVDCGTLKGGFISDEIFGKDVPQELNNTILSYELILQQNGNFSTKPSNLNEAF